MYSSYFCSQLSVALRFRDRPSELILIRLSTRSFLFYLGILLFTFLTQFAFNCCVVINYSSSNSLLFYPLFSYKIS